MHEAKGHFWHLGGMAPWSPKSAYDSLAPGSPSSPSLRRPNESRALFQPGFIIKIAGFMSFLLDFITQLFSIFCDFERRRCWRNKRLGFKSERN